MSNHNQHNENTPNKSQSDSSQLSEEQQSLLTADALGQLENSILLMTVLNTQCT